MPTTFTGGKKKILRFLMPTKNHNGLGFDGHRTTREIHTVAFHELDETTIGIHLTSKQCANPHYSLRSGSSKFDTASHGT